MGWWLLFLFFFVPWPLEPLFLYSPACLFLNRVGGCLVSCPRACESVHLFARLLCFWLFGWEVGWFVGCQVGWSVVFFWLLVCLSGLFRKLAGLFCCLVCSLFVSRVVFLQRLFVGLGGCCFFCDFFLMG